MGKCVSVEQNNRKPTESLPVKNEVKQNFVFERQSTLRHSIKSKIKHEAKTATVLTDPPNSTLTKSFLEILRTHFLFTMMSEDTIKHLILKMKTYALEANQLVFKQGDVGVNFFIVEKGKLSVEINDIENSVLVPFNCFGELGLIQDKERNCTVMTIEKTILRGIDRSSYRKALSFMNEKKHEENLSFIESVPIFKQLTQGQLQQLLQVLVTQKFAPGQNIVTEGQSGDLFYIIKEGTVHCTKKGALLRDFNVGEFFGEQALLYQSKRRATITAAGKVVVISIGRSDLIKALGQKLETIIYRNTLRIAFGKNSFVRNLNPSQIDLLIDKMEVKTYAPREVVEKQGVQKGEVLYIVAKGMLEMADERFCVYDMIGDEELNVKSAKRIFKNNLVAGEESDVAQISKIDFEEVIEGDLQAVLVKNNLIEVLRNVTLFRILPDAKLKKMIEVLKNQSFNAGEVIFQQGTIGDRFYIVTEGSVDIVKDGSSIRSIELNGYFGERAIILDEARTATAKAITASKCWVLDKANFKLLIDAKIHQDLLKRIELQNDSIQLDSLFYIKTLSKGIYGNNFVCSTSSSKSLFTLKTISRHSIALFNLAPHLIMEKKIMSGVDHPFIGKLIRTFKDANRVYFLSEHVKGIDLFDVLRELNTVSNENARFFTAGILTILGYLHVHNIIYRDLKPENVMIDEDGYTKIVDFGNAKIVENRTYSTVGTPHYMAPEVISGKGYSMTADYWSLGVMIYEFLFNKLPFCSDESDCFVIYQSILLNPLIYPIGNHLAKPLIDQLLFKNPVMRGTYRSIKEHSWFIGVNWDALLEKKILPPYKPKPENYAKELSQNKTRSHKDFLTKIAVIFT